ncbi:MAG TPA: hypothetical protein VHT02_00505 [Methylocella sp.]|nr:hypothetical protein [Methylocella sp.]
MKLISAGVTGLKRPRARSAHSKQLTRMPKGSPDRLPASIYSVPDFSRRIKYWSHFVSFGATDNAGPALRKRGAFRLFYFLNYVF